MSNENKSKVSKQIYDLYKSFVEYEKFIKNFKDIQYIGFLIKKELIEILKKNIFYEKFEEGIRLCNYDYKTLKANIEKVCGTKEIKTNIDQTIFNNSNDLIKELDTNQFYLINNDLWKVIRKKGIFNDKGIYFKYNNKEITLIFNENDKLKFKKDKFIISKETLIENQNNNNNEKDDKKNDNDKNGDNRKTDIDNADKNNDIKNNNNNKKEEEKKISAQNKKIQFIIEIKILINLFFYYEELKDQLIPQKPEFNPNNKNIIYLISKTWIEKYKSFFNYDKLKSHLIQKQYLSIKKSYNNDENKIEELIEKIESELPKEYIDEINNINNINELKAYEHKYNIKINKITKPINKELKYLNDYEIINNKIYGLIISEKYLENFYIQICNYYCINENNILIKFISEDKKYIDEIVCIDDKNSISPKYLLDYDGDINNLSNFMINNFINFCNKNEEYYCEILNKYKNIGYCYKIDSINKLEGKIEDEQKNLELTSNSLDQAQKKSYTGQNNENNNNKTNENQNQKNESQNNANQNNEGQNNINQNNIIQIKVNQNKLNQNNISKNRLNQINSNKNIIAQNNINQNNETQNNLNQNMVNQDNIEQINVNQNNKNLQNVNQNSINQNNTNQNKENGNNINEISSETQNHRNGIKENLNNQNNLNEKNANKSNDNINNIKVNEKDKEKKNQKNDGKKNEGDNQNNILQEITNISGKNNPVLNSSTEEEAKKKENEDSLVNKGVQKNVELEKVNTVIKEQNQGEKPFEKEIYILINIYIFNKILKEKSKQNSQNENINRKKCYLFNKAWIDNYKKIFLYDKLCNYAKDKNTYIKELFKNKSIFSDVYNLSKNDFENIKNEIQNLIKIQLSPNIKKLPTETKENKEIYYPDEFYIISENNYRKIKENFFKEKKEEKLEEEEYIYKINEGKILLKNISLSSNIKTYIILIVTLKDENLFVLESILNFEKEEDRDALFGILNGNKNDKYYLDMNETNIKSNGKSIGKIIKINNDDNRGNELINKYLKIRNKYLELLISIYLTKFKIKEKFKKKEANIEKYYIIRRKWIYKLLKYCKCENFLDLLNKKNVENIINENKFDNDDILIDKIISLFPSDFINDSNIKKEYNNELFNYLKNSEEYKLKLENFSGLYYFDNIELINNYTFNIINEIFEIYYEEEKEFIFKEDKIIMKLKLYSPHEQYNLLIYSIDNNNEISLEILINFKEESSFNDYFEKLCKNKIINILGEVYFKKNTDNNLEIKINEKITAYKIKNIIINNQKKIESKILNHKEMNENKDNSDALINQNKNDESLPKLVIKNIAPSSSDINISSQKSEKVSNQIVENKNANNNAPKLNQDTLKKNNSLKQINSNNHEEGNNENLIKKRNCFSPNLNELNNNDTNKEIIELSEPIKRGIITLIKYKESYLNLISKLDNSKKNNIISYVHVYLINEGFLNNYKKFHYYNTILNNININEDISLKKIEDSLAKNNYIKYFKERENQINFLDKLNKNKEILIEEKQIDNEKIIYPKEIEIVSDEVINSELIDNICNIKLKYDCLINDGIVIIKFILNNIFILLIGKFDIENKTNKFILRYLLKYPDFNTMEIHFNTLKNINFQIFNQKFKNEEKFQVCQLFKFKDNNITKYNHNKTEPKTDIYNILDQQKINHIFP